MRTHFTASRPNLYRWFAFAALLPTISILLGLIVLHRASSPVHATINETINLQGKLVNSDGTNITDGSYYFAAYVHTTAVGGSASASMEYKFSDTLNTVADTTITYTTGTDEATIKAGMVLYNTTDGDFAIIESVDTGTNTITLDRDVDTAPYGWVSTESITTRAQLSDGIFNLKIVDLGSLDFNTDDLYLEVKFDSTPGGGDALNETFSPRKRFNAVPYAFRAKYADSTDDISCTDCIDFTEIEDTMDLDANLIVNLDDDNNHFGVTVNADLSIASRSTDMLNLSIANDGTYDFTGDMIELNLADTGSSGRGIYISNLGTGDSFRINDESSDTTPFVIDDEGGVGIKNSTVNTSLGLHVLDDAAFYGVYSSNAWASFGLNVYWDENDTRWEYLGTGYGNLIQTDGTNGGIYFATAASGTADNPVTLGRAMTIDENANIVFGSLGNPSEKLTLYGDNNSFIITTPTTNPTNRLNIVFNEAGALSDSSGLGLSYYGAGTGDANYFSVRDFDTSTDLVWFEKGGSVGVGVSPTELFEVNGESRFWNNIIMDSGGTNPPDIHFKDDDVMLAYMGYSGTDIRINAYETGAGIQFDTQDVTKAYIESTGEFGINTSTPDAQLEVIDTSGAQLRLTYTDGSVYTDFETDGSGYLTINSTGNRVITTDSLYVDSDSAKLYLGDDVDLELYHNGTNGTLDSTVGMLYLDATGNINIRPGDDVDDYIYFDTTTDLNYIYWEGHETNDPGIGIDADGYLGYRDNNDTGWTKFNDFASGTIYWQLSGNVLNPTTDTYDFAIGGTDSSAALWFDEDVGDLAIDGDLTIDGGELYLTGIASSSSTTEGTMYYDSEDDQLKVYANGKWQSDRTTATVIVGTSNGSGASNNYEKADFVCGASDCDTTIESAITSLPAGGGVVALLEGLYIIDSDGIDITKANTAIVGTGNATILRRAFDSASNEGLIRAANINYITISNLSIDGQKGTYAGAENIGVEFVTVDYSRITNIWSHDNDGNGIRIQNSDSNIISGNNVLSNDDHGIDVDGNNSYNIIESNISSNSGGWGISVYGGIKNHVTGNTAVNSTSCGIMIHSSSWSKVNDNYVYNNGAEGVYLYNSNNSLVSGNHIQNNTIGVSLGYGQNSVVSNYIYDNTSHGIYASTVGDLLISGNYFLQNDGHGVYLATSNDSTITGNRFKDNGGVGANHSIALAASDGNVISGNTITDSSGTGDAINLSATCDNNYLTGNRYSGAGADTISDSGVNTTIQHQYEFDLVNVASTSGNVFDLNFASSTTATAAITGMDLDFTNLTADGTNAAYGLHINDFATTTSSAERGLYIEGTNYDYGLYVDHDSYFGADLTIAGGDILGANSAAIDLGEGGSGDIWIMPDGDTTNFIYLSTGTEVNTETVSAMYWDSILTYTNDPGFSVNDSGEIVYRDEDSASWVTLDSLGGATSVKWNEIQSPDGNQSLTMAGYTTTWTWDSLTTATGLTASSSSLSSGSLFDLSVASTAAASNTQKVLNLSTSGANVTSTQTTYGLYATNTHTGTASTNVAGYFSASGGTNNYAGIFAAGNVGIGTTTPDYPLQVNGTIAPETTDQDLGTASLQWDLYANAIDADSTITFSALTPDRIVSTTTGGQLTTSISSANAALSITDETGTGLMVFATSPTFTTDITTPSILSADDLAINPTGGDINIGSGDNINLTASTDLFFGSTSLGETTSATDSGAYIVGTFDEFDNSDSTNVQAVLNDLDAAIATGGPGALWSLTSGVIHPTTTTYDFAIGGTDSSAALWFDEDVGDLAIDGDMTIDGGELYLTGIASSSSTTEGTMYYDSNDDQLKVYANGKWQSDRTTATVIVGTSNGSGASNNYEKADFVCGASDCDTTIESAITALPAGGGVVALLEGTYVIDSDGIDIAKSNVTLTGTGKATVLQRGWDAASNDGVISAGTYTGITISNLFIDGQKGTYTGNQNIGIYFSNSDNSRILEVWSSNNDGSGVFVLDCNYCSVAHSEFQGNDDRGIIAQGGAENIFESNYLIDNGSYGIYTYATYRYKISNNIIRGSTSTGIQTNQASYASITGNYVYNNSGIGIYLMNSSDNEVSGNFVYMNTTGISFNYSNNVISANYIFNNSGSGITGSTTSNNVISGNTINQNGEHGISCSYCDQNTITGNKIHNNGGTGNSSGMYIVNDSDNNTISGNDITDTAGTGYAIQFIAGAGNCDDNYLNGNRYSGTGASSIADGGTNTTIQHQREYELDATKTTGTVSSIDWTGATSLTGTTSALAITASDITGNGQNFYGINISDLGTAGAGTEYGIYVQGTDWDYGLYIAGEAYLGLDLTVAGGDITGANSAAIDIGEGGSGDIWIMPDGDTTNFIYLSTGTEVNTETVSAMYWDSILTYTNDPGFSVNDSGEIVYRDEDSASWVTLDSLGGATSVKWNEIQSPDGNQSLTMAGYTTTWTWNSLTTATGLTASSSSLSSGSLFDLSVASTAAASNTQKVLNLGTSGANATSTQTTYGLYAANTHTGTASTNVAGYFSASGGSNNYAGIFAAGNVGIGTTTPDYPLQVNGTIAPETTDQDLGTASLQWDLIANTINADSTVTFSALAANRLVTTTTGGELTTTITSSGVDSSVSDNTGSGALVFGTSPTFTTDITTPSILAADDLTINPAGGDINLGSGDNLNLTASTDLFFGSTALGETTSATDSGAYIVGTFDEFDNSDSTNVQAVLNDLDAAIATGGPGAIWTLSGGVIYPTDNTNDFAIGGTGSSAALWFDESGGDLKIDGQMALNGASLAAYGINLGSFSTDGDRGINYTVSADTDGDEVYGIYGSVDTGSGTPADYRYAYGAFFSLDKQTGTYFSNSVGLGNDFVGTPTNQHYAIGVRNTMTAPMWSAYNIGMKNYFAPNGGSNDNFYGMNNEFLFTDADDDAATATGMLNVFRAEGNSSGQTLYGNLTQFSTDSGDTAYGLKVTDYGLTSTGGTQYGVHIALDDADVTNYGIYVNDSGGDTYFGDQVTIAENQRLYFDSADTYIYANTDDPEDLVFGADQDMIFEPDNNINFTVTSDTDDYIYLTTASDLNYIYWEGHETNDPGIGINASGELVYRDDNESGWTTFDSLSGGSVLWNDIGNPDGNQSLTMGSYTSTWTYNSLTTTNGLTVSSSSLTTGSLISLSSDSTAITSGGILSISHAAGPAASWTGSLLSVQSSGSDTGGYIDGSMIKAGITTSGAGEATILNITSAQTGTNAYVFRANDDGTYTDTTPFVIDTAGNVGIGSTGPDSKLDVLATTGSQLRLTYTDGSVYTDFTTDSGGGLTIAASGGNINVQPDGDIDDYIYFDTTSDLNYIYWEGHETNDPGIGINSDGTLVYRDDNDTGWKTFDSLDEWSVLTNPPDVTYLTDTTSDFAIGGANLTTGIFAIDESAGDFYFGYDQSANPTLLFEATDNDAGSLGFNTNDSFVFSDARVGIGTSGPDAKLDILDTTGAQLRLTYTDGSVYTNFTTDTNGYLNIDSSGNRIITTDSIYIDSDSSKLYLGDDADLEIYHNGSNAWIDAINGALYLDAQWNVFFRADNDTDDYIYFSTSTNNPGLYWENGTYDPYFLFTDTTDTLSIYAADTIGTEEAISITTAQISNKLPTSFDSAGDVSIAYDLVFTNSTAAYASFEGGPGYVRTQHASGNYDLTFSAANSGVVVVADDFDVEGDINLDASGTATTNGLCHSGSNSDTTFTDRDIVACSGAPGDIAEWYDTKNAVEGEIVVTTGETITYDSPVVNADTGELLNKTEDITAAVLEQSSKPYQQNILGVISTSPVQTFGRSAVDVAENPNPVALIGRVPVKVSAVNGAIKPGDPITTSSKLGVGMKATQPGYIIGRALEYFDPGNPNTVGKITVFINISWHEPETYTATLQSLISDYQNGSLGGSGGGGAILGWTYADGSIYTPADVVTSTISSTAGTFSLLYTETITVGDDKFIVDPDGNVDVAGDIILAGVLSGRYGDLTLKLGDSEGDNKFAIVNADDEEVFSVDSTGKISIKEDISEEEAGEVAGESDVLDEEEVDPDAVAGTAVVEKDRDSVIIETTQVTETSKIQITFRSDYSPASRYWISEQIPEESFTIKLNNEVAEDCEFDWWIIN